VERAFEQYQWHYKRFNATGRNPYWVNRAEKGG